jgi:hypothetical protein
MSVFKLLTGFVHTHPFFDFRNKGLFLAHIYACIVTAKNGGSCERGKERTKMQEIS